MESERDTEQRRLKSEELENARTSGTILGITRFHEQRPCASMDAALLRWSAWLEDLENAGHADRLASANLHRPRFTRPSEAEINQLEADLGFALPRGYRQFLSSRGPIDIGALRMLGPSEVIACAENLQHVLASFATPPAELSEGTNRVFPIRSLDGNYDFAHCEADARATYYFVRHDEAGLQLACPSFDDWLLTSMDFLMQQFADAHR